MTNDAGFRNYAADTLDRLRQRGISIDRRAAPALEQFVIDGFNSSIHERVSRERFEDAWEQLIEAILDYTDDTGTRYLTVTIFNRIKRRICPGFWPFC